MTDNPARRCLPRSAILRGEGAFSRVFESGEGTRVGQVIAKYRVVPSTERPDSAVGSIPVQAEVLAGFVTRRSTGSAVRRNRIRRMLREAFRLQKSRFVDRLPNGMSIEVVLLWSGSRDEALRPEFTRIKGDVTGVLHRIAQRIQRQRESATEQQQPDRR